MSTPTYLDRILRHARRTPGRPALRWRGGLVSYGDVVHRARCVAAALVAGGVRRGDPVGLRVPRGPGLVTGMLGIGLAGGVIVPMVPDEPEHRLRLIVADSGTEVVLTGAGGPAAPEGTTPVPLGADGAPPEGGPLAGSPPDPGEGAYLIYTSGSTGTPRGVLVEHHALGNYLAWCVRTLLDPAAPMPLVASAAFDAVFKQALGPLCAGDVTWLVDDATAADPAALARLLSEVPHPCALNCVPSMWRAVLAELEHAWVGEVRLHRLLLGGEPLDAALLGRTRALLPNTEVWNLYGPTEATANASAGQVPATGAITLGSPVTGAELRVVTELGEQAGPGEEGELYVGGAGLARGYLGLPAATAERFRPDPWSGGGARMFRTGDRVRVGEHGLEFLGRSDRMVKRAGVRVELGDIEHALRREPRIADAVAFPDPDDPARLVALAESWNGQPEQPAPAELRRWLTGWLPPSTVPDVIRVVDRLPRTTSGKVDAAALREPERGVDALAGDDPIVAGVAQAWAQVLELDAVGTEADFFELGGHSLAMVRIVGRLGQQFGVELAFDVFYDAPTVTTQAELIRRELEADRAPA